jgi:hypothetical protein
MIAASHRSATRRSASVEILTFPLTLLTFGLFWFSRSLWNAISLPNEIRNLPRISRLHGWSGFRQESQLSAARSMFIRMPRPYDEPGFI